MAHFTRSAVVATLGAPQEKVMVENGELVPRKVMSVNFTLDHRHQDGSGISKMLARFKEVIANLEKFE